MVLVLSEEKKSRSKLKWPKYSFDICPCRWDDELHVLSWNSFRHKVSAEDTWTVRTKHEQERGNANKTRVSQTVRVFITNRWKFTMVTRRKYDTRDDYFKHLRSIPRVLGKNCSNILPSICYKVLTRFLLSSQCGFNDNLQPSCSHYLAMFN